MPGTQTRASFASSSGWNRRFSAAPTSPSCNLRRQRVGLRTHRSRLTWPPGRPALAQPPPQPDPDAGPTTTCLRGDQSERPDHARPRRRNSVIVGRDSRSGGVRDAPVSRDVKSTRRATRFPVPRTSQLSALFMGARPSLRRGELGDGQTASGALESASRMLVHKIGDPATRNPTRCRTTHDLPSTHRPRS